MRASITHEFLGSNFTVKDFRELLEEIVSLPPDARVYISASDDQRDGNFVKFVVREVR